jgi:hypothetical protein
MWCGGDDDDDDNNKNNRKCTDSLIHPLIHSFIQVWSLFDIKSTQAALLVAGQINISPSPEYLAFIAMYRSCIILCDNQPSFCHVPRGIWSFE